MQRKEGKKKRREERKKEKDYRKCGIKRKRLKKTMYTTGETKYKGAMEGDPEKNSREELEKYLSQERTK